MVLTNSIVLTLLFRQITSQSASYLYTEGHGDRKLTFPLYGPLSLTHCFLCRREDKSHHTDLARRIAKSTQSVVLVPNYRLTPKEPTPENKVYHPSHANDILLFLTRLLVWDGPPGTDIQEALKEIHLIGHSCSAHMIASIVLDSTSITPSLDTPARLLDAIKGVIMSEGIFDPDQLVACSPQYREWFVANAFGGISKFSDFSVFNYPSREHMDSTRWLIVHSKGDTMIDIGQSQSMYEHISRLYLKQNLPIDKHVYLDIDGLQAEHDDIFKEDKYIEMVSSFILSA